MSTKNDPKLNQYLSELDQALEGIPAGDRAEIVTEIKSHILDAQEREPERDLSSILVSLGEAKNVANRYRMERGLAPGKPSRAPVAKWLTLGFLGTFGLICATILILVWKFTPLIRVDEKNGSVQILGGMIDVKDDGTGKVQRTKDGVTFSIGDAKKMEGSVPLKSVEELTIAFQNGSFETRTSQSGNVSWECTVHAGADEKFNPLTVSGKKARLAFDRLRGLKCEIQIPAGVAAVIQGTNGKITVDQPQARTQVTLVSGQIRIAPDHAREYRYTVEAKNGRADEFKSSTAKNTIEITASVVNGEIVED